MNEQIIINGKRVDIFDGDAMSFEIESNIMKKLDDLSCCYSYTLVIPNTTRNKTIFGDLLTIGRSGSKLYNYIDAEYYRDDLQIFSGKCYVSKVTENDIEINFKFGIVDALQNIKDDGKNLPDLFNGYDNADTSGRYADFMRKYTDDEMNAYKVELPVSSYDVCAPYPFVYSKPVELFMQTYRIGDDTFGDGYIVPAVNVKAAIDQITAKYGISFDMDDNPQKKWILSPRRARRDRFAVAASGNVDEFMVFYSDYKTQAGSYVVPLNDDDMNGTCSFEATDSETTRKISYFPNVKHKYRVNAVFYSAKNFPVDSGAFYYTPEYTEGEDGFESKVVFKWTSKDDVISGVYFPASDNIKNEFDGGTGPTFIFQQSAYNPRTHSLTYDFNVVVWCQLDDDECAAGYFNGLDCLPDISISNFIYDYIFGACGRFPVNTMRGGNVIKCRSFEEIAQAEPYDWTDKLDAGDLSLYPKIDGVARLNYIRYKADDNIETTDYCFPSDGEALDASADFASFDFGKYYAPHYIVNDKGESRTPSPRICAIHTAEAVVYRSKKWAALQNDFLDWLDGTTNGEIFAAIFKNPLRLECKIRLSSLDLSTIDLTRPVYLAQFGAKFFIQKLSVGETLTDAVLIKFK